MKKLETLNLNSLLAIQQSIELVSLEMRDHFRLAEEGLNQHALSQDYCDSLEKNIENRINRNNAFDTLLQKEIKKRLISVFGRDVTTADYMNKLKTAMDVEVEKIKSQKKNRLEQAEKIKKKHQKPVLKLDTKVSREKKHVKK